MDALKDALKQAIKELQMENKMPAEGMHEPVAEMQGSKIGDPQVSDKAPSVAMMSEKPEMEIEILKGISDHGAMGKGGGLAARASEKAKAKMASIQKHKSMKK